MKTIKLIALALFGIPLFFISCTEYTGNTNGASSKNIDAQSIYANQCGSCHSGNGAFTAPSLTHLASMAPRSIVSSLEVGKMQVQRDSLTRIEKNSYCRIADSK